MTMTMDECWEVWMNALVSPWERECPSLSDCAAFARLWAYLEFEKDRREKSIHVQFDVWTSDLTTGAVARLVEDFLQPLTGIPGIAGIGRISSWKDKPEGDDPTTKPKKTLPHEHGG